MRNFNTNTKNNDEWLTPPELIKSLGCFDLDPCSPIKRPWDTAINHFTISDDGLCLPWKGRVWLNPPYGRETFKWIKKLSEHKKGIALLFSRTETIGFHSEVWDKAHSVFFFKGRLKFHYVTGERGDASNAPSCLVSYSPKDTEYLNKFTYMQGKLIKLIGI